MAGDAGPVVTASTSTVLGGCPGFVFLNLELSNKRATCPITLYGLAAPFRPSDTTYNARPAA